jgi:hypothetical protein
MTDHSHDVLRVIAENIELNKAGANASVRCAFFDRDLHSRLPLVHTPAHLQLLHACDHWHSSRVATTSYRFAL